MSQRSIEITIPDCYGTDQWLAKHGYDPHDMPPMPRQWIAFTTTPRYLKLMAGIAEAQAPDDIHSERTIEIPYDLAKLQILRELAPKTANTDNAQRTIGLDNRMVTFLVRRSVVCG